MFRPYFIACALVLLGQCNLRGAESAPETNLHSTAVPAPKIFSDPGIATFRGSSWIGSDHLFNLSTQIYLELEIIKQPTVLPDLNVEALKEQVRQTLSSAGFKTPSVTAATPPLPLFNILVYINQIEKGFSVNILVRLLEGVQLARVVLQQSYVIQAITWERQIVLVTPAEKVNEEIRNGVQELTTSFVESYKYFQLLKNQSSNLKKAKFEFFSSRSSQKSRSHIEKYDSLIFGA